MLKDFIHVSKIKQDGNDKRINHFRVQQSLGTEIGAIGNMSTSGFSIKYINGDVCNQYPEVKFSARVDYICDTNIQIGKPQVVKQAFSTGTTDCEYVFEWKTKLACR